MRKILFILICSIISVNTFAYKVSKQGENNIKKYETCVLTAYWDSNGYSIGWGHHSKDIKKNQKISQRQADRYFVEDMTTVNEVVNRLLNNLPCKHNFPQNFIDGFGDLVYNCGEGNVKNSDFYKRLMKCRKNNKQDINYSISFVKTMCISANGHKQRRYDTHKMMLI